MERTSAKSLLKTSASIRFSASSVCIMSILERTGRYPVPPHTPTHLDIDAPEGSYVVGNFDARARWPKNSTLHGIARALASQRPGASALRPKGQHQEPQALLVGRTL